MVSLAIIRPVSGPQAYRGSLGTHTYYLALAGMMAAFMAVGSWISVPLYPVPVTLQTLAVLVAGGLLGRTWGPVAVAVYLGLGVVGVPVFHSGTAGIAHLVGPTGGYLVGFLPAAFFMGLANDWARRRTGRWAVAALAGGAAAASLVIYGLGVPWMAGVLDLGLVEAAAIGVVPYVPGDILKAVAAVVIIRQVGERLGERP